MYIAETASDLYPFSISLTQLINTYYALSQAAPLPLGSVDSIGELISASDSIFETTTMYGAIQHPHYALSIPWVVVDFVFRNILSLAALAALCLRRMKPAPDTFGYKSSLTHDIPHLDLPNGSTTLDGLQVARLLKHVKIRIADVETMDGGVGRVGLSYAEEQRMALQRGEQDVK